MSKEKTLAELKEAIDYRDGSKVSLEIFKEKTIVDEIKIILSVLHLQFDNDLYRLTFTSILQTLFVACEARYCFFPDFEEDGDERKLVISYIQKVVNLINTYIPDHIQLISFDSTMEGKDIQEIVILTKNSLKNKFYWDDETAGILLNYFTVDDNKSDIKEESFGIKYFVTIDDYQVFLWMREHVYEKSKDETYKFINKKMENYQKVVDIFKIRLEFALDTTYREYSLIVPSKLEDQEYPFRLLELSWLNSLFFSNINQRNEIKFDEVIDNEIDLIKKFDEILEIQSNLNDKIYFLHRLFYACSEKLLKISSKKIKQVLACMIDASVSENNYKFLDEILSLNIKIGLSYYSMSINWRKKLKYTSLREITSSKGFLNLVK